MEEAAVGIEEYTTATSGFTGILKHRYSDFQVFEVDQDGRTARLTSTAAPEQQAPPRDAAALTPESVAAAAAAFAALAGEANGAAMHQFLKSDPRLPPLATDTVAGAAPAGAADAAPPHNVIRVRAAAAGGGGGGRGGRGGRGRGRGQKRGGGEWRSDAAWEGGAARHVRFVMLKENMDTQAALSVISRMLHAHGRCFGFAGTKDKRGVTAQWVTAHKIPPARLAALNARLRGIKLGSFEFVPDQLSLGQLRGNAFKVLMRDVAPPDEAHVAAAVGELRAKGFINYFGLQRFGTGAVPTHAVGAALLRGEWAAATRLILQGGPGERPEIAAARALYLERGDAQGALKALPTFLVAERAVLATLARGGSGGGGAHLAALQAVPRTLRLMYLHAWQSAAWNRAASERVRRYGVDRVVAGDLVLLPRSAAAGAGGGDGDAAAAAASEVDQAHAGDDGDAPDAGGADGDGDEASAAAAASAAARLAAAHVVTADEAAAGTYGIADVVLPLPGARVSYPRHAAGRAFYLSLAAADGVALPGATAEEYAAARAGAGAGAGADDAGAAPELLPSDWAALAAAEGGGGGSGAGGGGGGGGAEAEGDARGAKRPRQGDAAEAAAGPEPGSGAEPGGAEPGGAEPGFGTGAEPGAPGGGVEERRERVGVLLEFTLPSSTYATMLIRELTKASTSKAAHKGLSAAAAAEAPASARPTGPARPAAARGAAPADHHCAMAPSNEAEAKEGSFVRRDLLLRIQAAAQAKWEAEGVFLAEPPGEGVACPEGKFFGNFPYPYMNGLLHLGHAFSLSKLEFASAYHRLCGRRVLFGQGFHCTGMPIKACADKLDRELATYGCPPKFPTEEEEEEPAPAWEILLKSGIPEADIPKFRDPAHWLSYFPPLAERDLRAMGCGVDWRRSFITTDMNPYYDAFVRWQFWTLKRAGKVVKDKRYAVFSPLDGQPCADHDRASGEGVGPQEYTLVKMTAQALPGKLAALEGEAPGGVHLMAATLRPETMYGQTNCWALPEGRYGAFRGLGGEVYIMTHRSALNLSYQDLLGVPLSAPNCPHATIYVLPLLTILTNKGTGIVTSVPSDSPDDYTALQDLKKKPKLREKYGVADEWVLPYEVIPIIDIPGYGDAAAQVVCEQLKVQSQNDTAKLAEAKQLVYLKGFTDGVLKVGPHAGRKVSEAKPLIRDELLASGAALPYSEPEKPVMSRSGDECVVALTDQWYLTYGEPGWQAATSAALEAMECYSEETKNGFRHCLGWLQQWACSRSFGLGTRLPWDEQYLIESLSDSTIYMAYYTIAQYLQNDDMYGRTPGPIPPEALTHEVWDYIFLGGPYPPGCAIQEATLSAMRREFEFWYPFDLRVSGKDLIQNHLTFSLYSHTAVWPNGDKNPGSFRCNGHLLLNSEKMSKSTGNFKTLSEAIGEYSADAMRWALADAGDGMDDANFETSTANAAILRLTKELAWMEEMLAPGAGLREGPPSSLFDRVFANELNIAVFRAREAYDRLLFREALKCAGYDLTNARDVYRFACGPDGMNRALIARYIEVSTLLLVPITPHLAEHVWGTLLARPGSVITAGWPAADEPDWVMQRAAQYIEDVIPAMRKAIAKAEAPPKKKKADAPLPPKVTHGAVWVAERFVGWQEAVLRALQSQYDASARAFAPDAAAAVLEAVRGVAGDVAGGEKALKQLAMPFAKYKMEEAARGGAAVLDVTLPFDEAQLLRDNLSYLLRSLNLQELTVCSSSDPDAAAAAAAAGVALGGACPGQPAFHFSAGPLAGGGSS
ncbi:leucine--tRNA ligase [Scenedesmus sp. PABB004]|nr:leucine--tRNA ligase [Scenedesmus sp. PABB004]